MGTDRVFNPEEWELIIERPAIKGFYPYYSNESSETFVDAKDCEMIEGGKGILGLKRDEKCVEYFERLVKMDRSIFDYYAGLSSVGGRLDIFLGCFFHLERHAIDIFSAFILITMLPFGLALAWCMTIKFDPMRYATLVVVVPLCFILTLIPLIPELLILLFVESISIIVKAIAKLLNKMNISKITVNHERMFNVS